MDAERKPAPDPRVEAIFQEAADIPVARRSELLAARCRGDSELRARVEELLGFLDTDEESDWLKPPFDPEQLPADAGAAQQNDHIGDYRIVREIGHGGMGVVFAAVKNGTERPVAVKVLRSLFAAGQPLARFQREVELQRKLSHPWIVPVLDSGSAELVLEGVKSPLVPFLVMELVEGVNIVQHAATRKLSHRDRVVLLRKVCEAVAHAHAHGIVHRDLKPANVLVDGQGEPRILDFGIARNQESDSDLLSTIQTQPGMLLGTLPYMSPEQVAGERSAVEAPGDVYSLGVLLHELLTGRRPLELTGLTLPEAALTIRNVEPPRPSLFSPRLRGDLDVILMHCLDKDPGHRYRSAGELGEELDRFLDGRRIHARAPGTLRRAHRFAQRHVGLVAGMAVAALALILGTVFSVSFGLSEAQQSRLAHRRMLEAHRQAYRANLAAASAHLRAGDGPAATQALDEADPRQRGWAWRHLRYRADPSLLSWQASEHGIECAASTPDGETIVTGDTRGQLSVWRARDGTLLGQARAHERGIAQVAISPDGRRVLTCDGRGATFPISTEVAAWSLRPLERLWRAPLRGHLSPDAFAPDSRRFVFGLAGDATLSIRDVEVGAELSSLSLTDRTPISAAWSPDGNMLAYWSSDNTTVVLDTSGKVRARKKLGLWGARFSRDGARLVSAREGIQVLDLRRETVDASWPERPGVVSARLLVRDDDLVLEGRSDGPIELESLSDTRTLSTLLGHAGEIVSMGRLAGHRFFSASARGRVRVWHLPTLASPRTLAAVRPGFVEHSVLDPENRTVVQNHWAQLELLDVATGKPLAVEYRDVEIFDSLTFSPDAKLVAGIEGRRLAWIDGRTMRILGDTELAREPRCQAWSARGLVVGTEDGNLVTYAPGEIVPCDVRDAGIGPLRFLVRDPDGNHVLAISAGGAYRLLRADDLGSVEGGRLIADELACVAFDADGRRLGVASTSGRVTVFDLLGGPRVIATIDLDRAPDALCFLEREDRVLVAVGPGLRILRVPSGDEILRIHHGQRRVHALRFDAAKARLFVLGTRGLSVYDSAAPRVAPSEILDWRRAGAIVRALFDKYRFAEDVERALDATSIEPPGVASKVREWVELRSDHPRFFNSEALKVVRSRDVPPDRLRDALRMIRIACKAFPDRPDMRGTLGGLLFRQGHCRKSIPHLLASESFCRERGAKDQPEDLAFLAMAYHEIGDQKAAKKWLAALEQRMDDPESDKYAWGRVLLEEARERINSREK